MTVSTPTLKVGKKKKAKALKKARRNGDGGLAATLKKAGGVEISQGSEKKGDGVRQLLIGKPQIEEVHFTIVGTTPYVQNKFSEKAKATMRKTQVEGSKAKKGTKKEPKDFQAQYEGSKHASTDGWCGIPAGAFRAAFVDACRLVGFKMVLAKMAVFIEPDGFEGDGTPLVKIVKGKPRYVEHHVRLQGTSTDLRARAMWDPGWKAKVRIKYDGDIFSTEDIANLLMRVGTQVGVGEGRYFSRTSCGMGWGCFEVLG